MTKYKLMNFLRAFSKALLFSLMALTLTSFTKQEQPDPNFHLYLLIGQSNMAGRGVLTPEYRNLPNPSVLMLNKEGKWVEASHPLHFDKPKIAGVGPGLAFGIQMHEAYPNAKIGLIPCAVGGTAIETWEPGVMDRVTKKYPYDEMIERLREAMKSGVVKGIIWQQGEANSTPERSAGYLKKLETLINRLRKEIGNKNLPFVVGELGRYRETYRLVSDQLIKLPGEVKYTAVASAEGLTHKGDNTHFDAISATELGKRFAKEMILLQQNKKR
jgi:hypothetical protein